MQDTPVPSFFAALSAAERAALCTDAGLRTLQAAFGDPRPAQTARTTLRSALLVDLFGGRAVVRLQLAGGGGPLDARSAHGARAGMWATPPSDANGLALAASAAAALGGA